MLVTIAYTGCLDGWLRGYETNYYVPEKNLKSQASRIEVSAACVEIQADIQH